jgi:hypothetical protein
MAGRWMSDELQRIWKESVEALIDVLFPNLPGKTEDTYKIPSRSVAAETRTEQPIDKSPEYHHHNNLLGIGFVAWVRTKRNASRFGRIQIWAEISLEKLQCRVPRRKYPQDVS